MKKLQQGFTLVEIMIVVAIIGILAAIAIPNFVKNRNQSQAKACISNMRQISTAAENYLTEHDMAPFSNWKTALVGTTSYIKVEPKCPAQMTVSYTIGDATTDPSCSYSQTDAEDTSTWHSLNRASTSTGT